MVILPINSRQVYIGRMYFERDGWSSLELAGMDEGESKEDASLNMMIASLEAGLPC